MIQLYDKEKADAANQHIIHGFWKMEICKKLGEIGLCPLRYRRAQLWICLFASNLCFCSCASTLNQQTSYQGSEMLFIFF